MQIKLIFMAHPRERLFNNVFMNLECWWREDREPG